MHRTEGSNNSGNLFTDGPPATCVEEDWLNAVQEEICAVIEGAGLTLLTAGTDTRSQLLAAIQSLVVGPLIVAVTGDITITAGDMNGHKTYANIDAVGAVNITLPAGENGYCAHFYVAAAQYLKVTAVGTDRFRYVAEQGAVAGYIRSNTVGTYWKITFINGNYVIVPLAGVITYDS